jgi:hypothetical protein
MHPGTGNNPFFKKKISRSSIVQAKNAKLPERIISINPRKEYSSKEII